MFYVNVHKSNQNEQQNAHFRFKENERMPKIICSLKLKTQRTSTCREMNDNHREIHFFSLFRSLFSSSSLLFRSFNSQKWREENHFGFVQAWKNKKRGILCFSWFGHIMHTYASKLSDSDYFPLKFSYLIFTAFRFDVSFFF